MPDETDQAAVAWWFRRAWFWRQTWGQVVVGTLGMIVTFWVVVCASEIWFRVIIALYFAFKVSGHLEDMIETDPSRSKTDAG